MFKGIFMNTREEKSFKKYIENKKKEKRISTDL